MHVLALGVVSWSDMQIQCLMSDFRFAAKDIIPGIHHQLLFQHPLRHDRLYISHLANHAVCYSLVKGDYLYHLCLEEEMYPYTPTTLRQLNNCFSQLANHFHAEQFEALSQIIQTGNMSLPDESDETPFPSVCDVSTRAIEAMAANLQQLKKQTATLRFQTRFFKPAALPQKQHGSVIYRFSQLIGSLFCCAPCLSGYPATQTMIDNQPANPLSW